MISKPTYEELEHRVKELEKEAVKRKQAEDALQESTELLKKSQAIAQIGSWELDLVANRLTWSDEVYRIFGLHPQEFDATYEAFLDAVHPDDRTAVEAAYSGSLREGRDTYEIEHRIVRRDNGEIRLVYEKCEHVKDVSNRIVRSVGMVQDITELKRAEEELKKLALVVKYSSELVNLATLDGKMIFLNEAGSKMLGIDLDKVEQVNIMEVIPDHLKGLVQTELLPALMEGKTWEGDLQYRNIKTGDLTDVHAMTFTVQEPDTQKPLFLANVSLDISERKRTEEALRQSEEKYKSFIENAPVAMYTINTKGKFTYGNKKLLEMTGHKEEDWLNKSFHPIVYPEDLELVVNKIQDRIEGKGTADPYEVRIFHSSGDIMWVKINSESIYETDERGNKKLVGMQSFVEDVTDRKQAEETLRENERFLQSVFDGIQDGISVLSPELNIIRVNQWMEKIYSDQKPLTGKKCYKVYQQREGVCSWCPSVKAIKTGEPQSEIVPYPTEEDPKGWFDLSAFPIQDAEGRVTGVIEHVKDITDRKQAEEALRKSEERYRSLFESTGTATFVADEDMTILQANAKCEEISGYSIDEIVGKLKSIDFIPVEDLERIKKYHLGRREKDSVIPDEYEFKLVDKNGYKKDVLIQVGMIPETKQSIASIIDISPLRQAEEALRKSEEKFRDLANSLPQIVYELDANGIITFANRNAFEIFGYTQNDLDKGIAVLQMLIPEDRDRALENIQRRLGGEEFGSQEYTALRKDGGTFPVAVHVTPVIRDKKPSGLRGIMIDLTDRKRAEEEKKKLEAQFQQVQRMESLGTLAGGIAHDFNNLLMGIQGRTSLMLLDIDSYDSYYEHLKGIEDYVKSASDLTKQLLGFARGGKYEVKPTDLNQLLDKSSKMFGRTKKEVTIHRKSQKNIWTTEVDRNQIEQVLLNLFVNAWQSMPGGGELYLETENVMLDADYVRPYSIEPGKFVKISVTDTGVGMDKATQERIFDPFFTTKEMGRGTGLGLASAYGIIKNHNGFINVYSEKGEGTTFNIYLPVSEKEAIEEKKLSEEVIKGKETVLLVDDEEMIIEVGRELLKKMGYKVLIAKGGKAAIELYETNNEEIDIVILDMIMPDMGGGETYDRLKEINPDINVLLSSGYSINGKATEILKRGCDGFIQKPFSMIGLSQKIREILDKN